uniref:ABC transporter G family member 23-like n=1 Tax=Oncorhynchus gorbuscha TaxID=8017 RepID=UPI001EAE9E36
TLTPNKPADGISMSCPLYSGAYPDQSSRAGSLSSPEQPSGSLSDQSSRAVASQTRAAEREPLQTRAAERKPLQTRAAEREPLRPEQPSGSLSRPEQPSGSLSRPEQPDSPDQSSRAEPLQTRAAERSLSRPEQPSGSLSRPEQTSPRAAGASPDQSSRAGASPDQSSRAGASPDSEREPLRPEQPNGSILTGEELCGLLCEGLSQLFYTSYWLSLLLSGRTAVRVSEAICWGAEAGCISRQPTTMASEAAAADDAATTGGPPECTEMEEQVCDVFGGGKDEGRREAPPPPGAGGSAIPVSGKCVGRAVNSKSWSNLNLTVPQGQIYGLLGPSGCGKTTLLKCIVGTLKISRGHISVLGKPPAFPGHQVPGRMVGYMPQDLALYNEFTISDTLTFFGRIHGLSSTDTQARMDFLVDFLDLPQKSKLVRNLRIWQHLVEIVKTGKVSVVITTHYIEEARQANVVGLMRNGRLLAEGHPETMMKQHNAPTLEKAFLQLCETSDQVDSKHSTSPLGGVLESSQSFESGRDESLPILGAGSGPVEELPKYSADWKVRVRHVMPKWRNIAALIIKTTVRMKRMPGSLCFQFLLPVIQISLMCLCIGGDPKEIQVAVVNNETSSSSYSQSLLSFLDNSSVQQVNLSHAEAFAGAYNGEYWAVIGFGKNFTSYLTKR